MDPLTNDKSDAAVNRLMAAQTLHKVANPRFLQVFKADALEDARIKTEVHVHDGPAGVGYTVYTTASVDGKPYLKARGVGPHSQTHDWLEIKVRLR